MLAPPAFRRKAGAPSPPRAVTPLNRVRNCVTPERVSELVGIARDIILVRGKAELGGKTVLHSPDTIAHATDGKTDSKAVADAVGQAVDDSLDAFRNKQTTISRARMFRENTIDMDDPGRLAMQTIVKGLSE